MRLTDCAEPLLSPPGPAWPRPALGFRHSAHLPQLLGRDSNDGPWLLFVAGWQRQRWDMDAVITASMGHRCCAGGWANDNDGTAMRLWRTSRDGNRSWCPAVRCAAAENTGISVISGRGHYQAKWPSRRGVTARTGTSVLARLGSSRSTGSPMAGAARAAAMPPISAPSLLRPLAGQAPAEPSR